MPIIIQYRIIKTHLQNILKTSLKMLIGATRSRRSKGIQYNGQNEKGQRNKQRSTNNYTENEISIYTNSRWTQVHISQGRAYKLNIRLLYDGKCIIHSRDLELLWWPSALYIYYTYVAIVVACPLKHYVNPLQ
jgi:hypothetical protein